MGIENLFIEELDDFYLYDKDKTPFKLFKSIVFASISIMFIFGLTAYFMMNGIYDAGIALESNKVSLQMIFGVVTGGFLFNFLSLLMSIVSNKRSTLKICIIVCIVANLLTAIVIKNMTEDVFNLSSITKSKQILTSINTTHLTNCVLDVKNQYYICTDDSITEKKGN